MTGKCHTVTHSLLLSLASYALSIISSLPSFLQLTLCHVCLRRSALVQPSLVLSTPQSIFFTTVQFCFCHLLNTVSIVHGFSFRGECCIDVPPCFATFCSVLHFSDVWPRPKFFESVECWRCWRVWQVTSLHSKCCELSVLLNVMAMTPFHPS